MKDLMDRLFNFNLELNNITNMNELLDLLEQNCKKLAKIESMDYRYREEIEEYKQKIFLIKIRILSL